MEEGWGMYPLSLRCLVICSGERDALEATSEGHAGVYPPEARFYAI